MLLSAHRAVLHSQVCSESEQVSKQHVTLSMLILAEGGVAKACPALGSHSPLLSSQSLFHENEMGGGTLGKGKSSTECQEFNAAFFFFFLSGEPRHALDSRPNSKKKNKKQKTNKLPISLVVTDHFSAACLTYDPDSAQ